MAKNVGRKPLAAHKSM